MLTSERCFLKEKATFLLSQKENSTFTVKDPPRQRAELCAIVVSLNPIIIHLCMHVQA
jgi:hypothetical protein